MGIFSESVPYFGFMWFMWFAWFHLDWFGCEGYSPPHFKKCSLEFLQKNFFLQVRLLFHFNQTLPQRSQKLHIRKQMNIRKVPSLPTPVFYHTVEFQKH